MAKIYLSSTYSDLKEHREAVYHALRKMRHDVIAMEHYVAADQRPLDRCLEDVCGCDLYIGLYAWRYGYVPSENNPEQKSITELEYRTAVKQGKPMLLFLLDENALWSPKWMDSQTGEGNTGALIQALRQEFLRDRLVNTFQGKEDIANVVVHSVHDWEKRHHFNTTVDPFLYMRTKYLEQVHRRYSSVKLPIGSPQGLSLHAIFQPLTLRRDPLVAENLTRDKRRLLLGETSEEYERRQGSDGLDNIYTATQEMTAENAEEALKKSYQQRMVVLGGPGTGKTTTLKHLAARQAHEALENTDAPAPIYLSLAALARSGKSLQRYLVDIVEDMEVAPTYADLLWHDMQRGRAYVCLDSLDEVDPKLRSDMVDLTNRKAQEPGNTWIVGSRFTEYKGGQFKAGRFSEWEIQPMSATLRKELACRLFPELHICLELTHQEPPTAQTFVSLLEQHPRASTWGENPLLLSLAAVVFLQQGYLPTSRILLYQHVIEAVLATREPDPIRQKILLRMLTELALWVHQQRGRTFTTGDLINFFMEEQRRSWGETNDLIHAVINSGIVEIVARQTYGFRHQTFQEYLAAFELARRLAGADVSLREQTEVFIWSKRTYSRWTEILRMMIGILVQSYGASGLRKASQWIEKLAQQCTSEEGDPGFLCFSLALVAVSELGEILEWHSPQTIKLETALLETWFDELILAAQRDQRAKTERLTSLMSEIIHFQELSIDSIFEKIVATLKNKSRSVRERCIKILGKFGSRSINTLLQLLQDRTFDSDYVLLSTLKKLSEYVPLEPLLAALHHEVISVHSRAVKAIGNLGERAPLEPLLAALHDEHVSVREGAITALGNLGERAPLEPLLAALHDTASSMRSAAAEALGNLGDRTPLEPLLVALHDEDVSVREATVRALGNLGDRTPLEPLLVALYDFSWFVRSEAMGALGNLGERVPLDPLLDALHDPNPDVRAEAAKALRQRKDIAIEQMLMDEIDGSIRSPYLYRIAIETLGYLREPIPSICLFHALHDANPFMREVAVAALGITNEDTYLEALIEALHDPHPSVRRAAALTLRNWKEPTPFEPLIIEPLLDTLRDADSFVRQEAAVTLGVLGEHAPLAALFDALHDTNSNVRSAALTALGNLQKYILLPLEPLLNALHDTDSSVRSAAVTALGNLGINAPLDPLIDAIHDTDSSVRSAAIEALGSLGKRAPLDLLLDTLHDTDFSMRRAAVTALGNLGERVLLQPLLDALHDTDPNVQRAAGEALGKMGDCVPQEPLLDALYNADIWTRLPATTALGRLGERAPLDPLLDILYDWFWSMRSRAVDALGNLGDRVPLGPLLEILQDENSLIRKDAIRIIQERNPEALQPLAQEVLALLQGDPPGPIFRSIAFSFFTNTLGNMGSASPDRLEQLTELLQWPYWQVRVKAASALGKIRRNIPDEAIRRLLVLQRDTDPQNRAVQKAADDALAEILSLETGIEDD